MLGNLSVEVRNGDVEGALKRFQKLTLRTGLFREIRAHDACIKPSLRRRLKSLRARKVERKRVTRRGVWVDQNGDPV